MSAARYRHGQKAGENFRESKHWNELADKRKALLPVYPSTAGWLQRGGLRGAQSVAQVPAGVSGCNLGDGNP